MVSLCKSELQRIENCLDDSLESVDENDVHGRYEAHRAAFNELMGMVKVYGPILNSIKEEYESLIKHIMKNQQNGQILEEELTTACSYPITIENYERRCLEIREKLHRIRKERDHKMEQIRDVQLKCQNLRKAMDLSSIEDHPEPLKIRKEFRRLPCMNLASLTDLPTMQKMCDQLTAQRSQLKRTQETKYVKKEEQIQLESNLKDQIVTHDQMRQQVKDLIRRKFLMQAALADVRSFGDNQIRNKNIGEIMVESLLRNSKSIEQKVNKSEEDSVEDEINKFFPESSKPLGSLKETDYIVLCIRQFERLFQEEKYQEAADLAVIVPRGVLRNYSTLLKFKDVCETTQLYYCQQVISTMKTGSLDPDMSYECVDIALKVGRIDLVNLWISKGRLLSTELIAENLTCYADLIPDHKIVCLDLAASLYWDLLISMSKIDAKDSYNDASVESQQSSWNPSRRKYFDSILECRIKAGRIEEVIEMLTKENSTPVSARSIEIMYKEEDIRLLVQYYLNIDLIKCLVKKELISLASVLNVLLANENYSVFVILLIQTLDTTKDISAVTEVLCNSITNGISTQAWEWMLNFVDESNEKSIIEIAASYLVRVSLERSCEALFSLE